MASNEEIQKSNDSFYLILNRESDLDIETEGFKDRIEILNFIPSLNLMNVRASRKDIQKMVETNNICLINKSVIEKIEPFVIQKIKFESPGQEVIVSFLVDISPYNKEIITELKQIEGIEVMKEYPFVSAVHVSFPVNKLLQIASIDVVTHISDSKSKIFPLGGA